MGGRGEGSNSFCRESLKMREKNKKASRLSSDTPGGESLQWKCIRIFFFPKKSKSKNCGSHRNLLHTFDNFHCSYSLPILKALSVTVCPVQWLHPRRCFISGHTNSLWHRGWLLVTGAWTLLTSVVLTTSQPTESAPRDSESHVRLRNQFTSGTGFWETSRNATHILSPLSHSLSHSLSFSL